MDPNANLREQLELAKQIINAIDHDDEPPMWDVNRLAELVIELDSWIVNSGSVPDAWKL